MSKITVSLQALAWAVLGYFGITQTSPHVSEIVTPALTLLAGFIGPAIIEWGTVVDSFVAKHRNELSTLSTLGAGVLAWAVANQNMNPKFAGFITAVIVAAAHLLNPSTAHPSRLP